MQRWYYGFFLLLFCLTLSTSNAQWTTLTDYPGTKGTSGIAFSIGDKGYAGMGANSSELWEYDTKTDTWTKKAPIPGGARAWAFAFAIDGKGYVGCGTTTGQFDMVKDFWEYDPATDTWTQKADFEFLPRAGMSHFVIDGIAYVGGGYNGGGTYNDFAKYDPVLDQWDWVGYWPGDPIKLGTAFALNGKGYVGTGSRGVFGDDFATFYEFDPTDNSWTRKTDFPGGPREGCVSFVAGGKGYIGAGQSGLSPVVQHKDFYGYDPETDSWEKLADGDIPSTFLSWCVSFTIDNVAYVGMGTKLSGGFDPGIDLYSYSFGSLIKSSLPNNEVDFGTVLSGNTTNEQFNVINGGSEALTISEIGITGDANGVFSTTDPTLPYTLNPGESVQIEAMFTPSHAATFTATLFIKSDAKNTNSLNITLKGDGREKEAAISLSTSTIDFGSVIEGNNADKTLDISNTGDGDLVISDIIAQSQIADVYSLKNVSLPLTIAPGAKEIITVNFAPVSPISYPGELTITSNASNGATQTVTLIGSGGNVTRTIELDKTSISIEGVEVGKTGEDQFEISSTGDGDLTIQSIDIENDPDNVFTIIEESFPVEIPAGSSASFTVRFAPKADGVVTSSISVKSNADNGSNKKITVTGAGFIQQTSDVELSETELTFGDVVVDQTKELTFEIRSVGALSLKVQSISINGDNDDVYSYSGINTPTTLLSGGKKTVTVTYNPSTVGEHTASVVIATNAPGSETVTVELHGRGTTEDVANVSIDVSQITFGTVVMSKTKDTSITVRSTGNANLIIQSVSVKGTDNSAFTINGFSTPATILPNMSADITLVFAPTHTGMHTASLEIATYAPGSETITIDLKGLGNDATPIELGVPIPDNSAFTLFPNPVTSGRNLAYSYSGLVPAIGNITVFDALGRVVTTIQGFEALPGAHSIPLETKLRQGMYHVVFDFESETARIPLLVVSR